MRYFALLLPILFLTGTVFSQQDYVANTMVVKQFLEDEISTLKKEVDQSGSKTFDNLKRLQDIGAWEYVTRQVTSNTELGSFGKTILKVRQAWLLNDFFLMESLLNELTAAEKERAEARRLFATLHIESWELQKAVDICNEVPNQIAVRY